MRQGEGQLRVEGRLVNHDESFDGAVLIDSSTGLITAVERGVRGESDLDTTDCLIFPGFGDVHVHAREDPSGEELYKEDFATASAAAIHGGVVHFADMPNNPAAPVNDASYAAKARLAGTAAVHVTLYGGIGPETQPLSHAVPYKAFMGPSVGTLFFRSSEELEAAIARYRGQHVSFHCEDPQILDAHRGEALHEDRRPAQAEVSATDLALRLIEQYELQGKLCHYSTREGLPSIVAARARGVRVTCEVTPHHLFFDRTMLTAENRPWLQMNPPLRTPEDRLALIEALRRGEIEYIATDHAPHTHEEKLRGTSGVPHLDTYGAFATWLLREQNFTPEEIARVCAWNPGQFVRPFLPASLGKGFGHIEAGYVGSLTVLDPARPWTVRREQIRSRSAWSPFEGFTLPGRVRWTVVAGRVYAASSDVA